MDDPGQAVTVPFAGAASDPDTTAIIGGTIGRFVVSGMLGSGGMGVVLSAHDPELDRKVAIKLLRADACGLEGRARLFREAKAMAQLAHPNVIAVYDVGTVGDQAFVAMELIDGVTLAVWMQTPRPWREVVTVFVAAGRGLAAAHAIGLVHRDVKPGNIIVGHDGRARIGDFGLVTSDDHAPAVSSIDATQSGRIAGTPAYMSPEQRRGEVLDARSDLYSFCVSLDEALTGGLRDEPSRRPLNPRLRRVLARGLDERPDRRYPSMDALLAELARIGRGRRWTWPVVAVATAAVAALAVALATPARSEVCARPTARLAGVWDLPHRSFVYDRMRARDRARGAERFAAAAAVLDPYARGWSDMHVEACRATRVTGAQSDTLLDLRMRCLDRRLSELAATADLLAGAPDTIALDKAVASTVQITPLGGCADGDALTRAAPPPEEPVKRAQAEQIADETQAIQVAVRTGRLDGLPARAKAVVARARAIDHAPSLAAALLALAKVQLGTEDVGVAIATLQELTQVAAAAHDDAASAMSWTMLIQLIGRGQGKPDEALALDAAASAAVVRAGDSARQRAELLIAEAIALETDDRRGADALTKLDLARRQLDRMSAVSEQATRASLSAAVWGETGNARVLIRDYDGAIAAYRQAIALFRQIYGPDHPKEAFALGNLGNLLQMERKPEASLGLYREAVRIQEARLGETPAVAATLGALGGALNSLHRFDEARQVLERSLQILRARLGPNDPQLVENLANLAVTMRGLDRFAEARAQYDEAIALMERLGKKTLTLPRTVFNRGELAHGQGRFAEALPDYQRASALFEQLAGPTSFYLIETRLGEGQCLLELGRPAEAIAPLERIRTLETPGLFEIQRASAGFYLGRALFESKRDPARGLATAHAARAELAAFGDDAAGELADADRWLARHR